MRDVALVERDLAIGDARVVRLDAQHNPPQHGLARARLTDQTDYFPRRDADRDATQDRAIADLEMQIGDVEQWNGPVDHHRRSTGSSASRRPSPSAFMPSTAAITHSIGKAIS